MKNQNHLSVRTLCFGFLAFLIIGFAFAQSGEIESRFSTGDNRQVAVLDFEQEGTIGIAKYGGFAADELTTALFIKKKLKVADRSLVKAKAGDKNVSAAALNEQQVHDFGEAVNADYLILGKLVFLSGQMIASETNEKISVEITLRLLSTKDGSVVGMANRRKSKKETAENVLREMLWDMAGVIELK